MADPKTIEVYESLADRWVAARSAGDKIQVDWIDRQRLGGRLLDIGCGPGWHLTGRRPPTIALDVSNAMLAMVADNAPAARPVRSLAESLPFATGSIAGALANRVYVHLPAGEVPLALAELHRVLAPDGLAFVTLFGDESGDEFRGTGPFAGRLFSGWTEPRLRDMCWGAGFEMAQLRRRRGDGRPSRFELRLRRRFTLPDTVGPSMTMLVCGLNPSIHSAEVGVGFARPGNRFWPAALQAGLVSRDRDPRHALVHHGVGMTDLAKRPTRRADELSAEEYAEGLQRVERLAGWLQPATICFVGLAGWRTAVDRKATAGPQRERIGGASVYVMPSTSGLNASSRLADLTEHLRAAAGLCGDGYRLR